MSRDRTSEFVSLAQSLRSSSSSGGSVVARRRKDEKSSTAQFMQAASGIGQEIHQTSLKLQRLTKLAKTRSLYNDRSAEISELTYVIKQDITELNSKIDELASVQSDALRGSTKHASQASTNIIDTLKSRLIGQTKTFKDVLQVRNENIKKQEQRRNQFSAAPGVPLPVFTSPPQSPLPAVAAPSPSSSFPSSSSASPSPISSSSSPFPSHSASFVSASSSSPFPSSSAIVTNKSFSAGMTVPVPRRNPNNSLTANETDDRPDTRLLMNSGGGSGSNLFPSTLSSSSASSSSASSNPLALSFSQSQQQAQMLAQQDSYLNARAESSEQIHRTIADLGQLFAKLGDLISQQQNMIDRIDDDVENSLQNVKSAESQLLQYYRGMMGNKGLILKVFFILVLFIIFFVVFLA